MYELKTELFEKLSKLQWLLRRLQLQKSAENGPMADTTRGQGRILAILKLQDGISTKDLSYLLGIRVSSLNELLAKMEKADYIKREPSETDRRVMLVKLTEKGRNAQQSVWNPEDIFSCLSEADQNTLNGYLESVIKAIEAEIGVDENDDARAWWMGGGRERMGDEHFERFASLRRGGFANPHFGQQPGFDPRQGFGQRQGGGQGQGFDPHQGGGQPGSDPNQNCGQQPNQAFDPHQNFSGAPTGGGERPDAPSRPTPPPAPKGLHPTED